MVADGERFAIPDARRPIDIGYRGRPLAAHMGRGALEKYEIGHRFAQMAEGSGLTLDIGLEEHDRLYGDDWPRFLARCKGMLGVESGVSVFDLDDRVADRYERLSADGRKVALKDLVEAEALEDKVYYRTISPRHFEAAAMRTCQILFEGRYSGAMEPMVHYIPLRKDFSNFDEVVSRFRDPGVRRELTENAYRDLIASGRYSYARFIEDFDRDLTAAGLQPEVPAADAALARSTVESGRRWRGFKVQVRWIASTSVSIYVLGNLFRLTGFLRRGIARLRRLVPG
jgi:hypothetical protein